MEFLTSLRPARMTAKAHATLEVFQFEDVIREHRGKFLDDRDGRTPGGVEFQERLDGFGVRQGAAALLTGQDDHRLGLMHCLAVGAFGQLTQRLRGIGVGSEVDMTGIPFCLPKFAAPFITT